jgi:hypothetical protein
MAFAGIIGLGLLAFWYPTTALLLSLPGLAIFSLNTIFRNESDKMSRGASAVLAIASFAVFWWSAERRQHNFADNAVTKYGAELVQEIGPPPEGCWEFEAEIKRKLKDPDTYKETDCEGAILSTFSGQKAWSNRIKYRAKNGFGGMSEGSATGYFRNKSVLGITD